MRVTTVFMDKTAIARLCRVSWRTVGRACERVVATELDPNRLAGLFRIGVDEISWRKHHKYRTLVVDHDRACVEEPVEGLRVFAFSAPHDELGPQRAGLIEAVSMDLGPALLKASPLKGTPPGARVRRRVPSRQARR